MTAAGLDQDVAELALRLAVERAGHRDADDLAGRRRTRAAFRRWREKIPPSLAVEADAPILVARHRDYWLGSVSSFVRSLDPAGLGSAGFHAVDFSGFGISSEVCHGFTFDGLFDVARSLLPVSARRGPVVAINVDRLARRTLARLGDDIDERTIVETIRIELSAVGLHEAAHAVDQKDDGVRLDVAPAISFPMLRARVDEPENIPRWRSQHGIRWIRSLAHLCRRATRTPPRDWWLEVFTWDVAAALPGDPGDWLDVLSLELAAASPDEPIAEILDRDPPPAFVRLFDQRSAATAAQVEEPPQ